ncbi:hypothetical protein [Deinococcus sp. 23YEL01]|uniref:hypothetical protein n=1 Tax=Deinococcus sp. 23YEL01 TaxID=2745871 RepID=UPI001E2FC1B2|nr:hypothetical protein [Deinococcus sp. 23YEL01]MCD0170282.1 hypothetical protein [Deinococcus sp. 23YEL01]
MDNLPKKPSKSGVSHAFQMPTCRVNRALPVDNLPKKPSKSGLLPPGLPIYSEGSKKAKMSLQNGICAWSGPNGQKQTTDLLGSAFSAFHLLCSAKATE